jgi:hypothetical protein
MIGGIGPWAFWPRLLCESEDLHPLNLHNFSYFPRFEDFPDVGMCVVGEYYQIDLTIRVQGFSEDSGFEEAL